uniref:Autophagy-related protein 101 n=1 Tax=Rhabditophanes sp. KR3021 TaxID=114890 RepID=A0AC35TK93_9BILA
MSTNSSDIENLKFALKLVQFTEDIHKYQYVVDYDKTHGRTLSFKTSFEIDYGEDSDCAPDWSSLTSSVSAPIKLSKPVSTAPPQVNSAQDIQETVEIVIFAKHTFKNDQRFKDYLEKIELEINPHSVTLRAMLKTIFPCKDPDAVIVDGVYFRTEKACSEVDVDEAKNWLAFYPLELNFPLVEILRNRINAGVGTTFLVEIDEN